MDKNSSRIGIVLKTINYKEKDKVLTIFSKEEGKISFVARGTRSITSKNRISTELFVEGEYFLIKGKAYNILKQGNIINSHTFLRRDLEKMSHAMFMGSFLDIILPEGVREEGVYSLFTWVLKRINISKDKRMLLRYFIIKTLNFLGYSPSISISAKCNHISSSYFYNLTASELLCERCSNVGFRLDNELIDLYVKLEGDNLSNISCENFSKMQLIKFDNFLQLIIENIIERKFEGFKILEKLTFYGNG